MHTYFPKKNWEDRLYLRLNELIDRHKSEEDIPESDRPYVVFDCDDTTLYSDTEIESLHYILRHLLFDLDPITMKDRLLAGNFDYDQPLLAGHDQWVGRNFVEDIVDAYELLYDLYIQREVSERPHLASVWQEEAFKNFYVKYVLFYNLQWSIGYEAPGLRNAVAFFAGRTEDDLMKLSAKLVDQSLKDPLSKTVYQSSEMETGRTGLVSMTYQSGMRIKPELQDLYQAFQEQGIIVYVVSGSAHELVVPTLERYYSLPGKQVYGMRYTYENDIMTDRFAHDWPTTLGRGKVATIDEKIRPLQNGRQPLAVFGNSSGDFDMVTAYEDMELGVLFNRNLQDRTQTLVEEAVADYESGQARYYLQGVDENTGRLYPSQSSLPFGSDKPLLYAKEEKTMNKYSQE